MDGTKNGRMKGLTKECVKESTKECMEGKRKDGWNAKCWKEENNDEWNTWTERGRIDGMQKAGRKDIMLKLG
jgi:hypothetical protein